MFDLNSLKRRMDRTSGFVLETHVHTSNSSKCSSISAKDMVSMYKTVGYDGVIVTDHFLTGNTCVCKDSPWEERIDRFFDGFDEAYEYGQRIGLRVFEGLEYSHYGTDFIVLGLSRHFIKENEKMIGMKPDEFLPFFRDNGAFIIQAHPYREADYIRQVRSYAHLVDAFEVVNLGNFDRDWDNKAYEESIRLGIPMTSGSDCHHFGDDYLGAGIVLSREPKDLDDICSIIRSNKDYFVLGR